MRRGFVRGGALAIVLGGALYATAQVGNGTVVANPPVTFVVTAGGSGSATAILDNTSAGPFTVELSPDASCRPSVEFQILGTNPFTLGGLGTKPITLTCAAGQPGMERCLVHATDANTGDALADLLAVCERSASASLAPSPTMLDFGAVIVGDTSSLPLVLQNNGATTIRRMFFQTDDLDGNFELSAPCNPDAPYCDGPIAPLGAGAAMSIFVKCTPRTAGVHNAQLEIATDTSQHASQRVMLTCMGSPATVPVLGVSPATIEIADPVEVVGASAHTALHLQNLGMGNVQVTDIRTVDVDSGAALDWTFSLTGTCTGTPCNLPTGHDVAIDLTFDPSGVGTRRASLLISFHDTIDRTRSIPLAAIGQGATLELFGPALAFDFGSVPVGRTASLDFRLVNRGNRDTMPTLAVAPAGPFSLSPSPSTTVTPTAPRTVTATCAPTAPGTFMTTITAQSSDTVTTMPVSIQATCTGTTTPLFATPSALSLGEIRIGAGPQDHVLQLSSTGAALTFTGSPHLDTENANITVGTPTASTTPASLTVSIDPQDEGDIKTNVVVTDSAGDTLLVPIAGRIVTASFTVPDMLDLGTFCVGQPTASSNVSLTSDGTATITLGAPAVPQASSFEVAFSAPTVYPATLPPTQIVTVAVTPQRQAAATTLADNLTWTTDVEGRTTATTAITARFIDSGGAIAPPVLDFGKVPVHLFVDDGQRVMIQNCNTTVLELDPPTIKAPFSIDSPNFPTKLDPNETAIFSVGFHPTRPGVFTDMLAISSPQLPTGMPLTVALVGESLHNPDPVADAGVPQPPGETSFYACSCAGSRDPSGGLTIVAALALVTRRRRSRARARRRRRPAGPARSGA